MNQLDLFEDTRYSAPVRRSDPATSQRAAREIAPKIGKAASCMFDSIEDANNIDVMPTANEAAARCVYLNDGLAETDRKRTGELLRSGKIEVVGERVCGVTGRTAQTYRVVGKPRG